MSAIPCWLHRNTRVHVSPLRAAAADISSHVATQTCLSKTAADSAVNAIFSAISDALAREETVAIAGRVKQQPEPNG